MTIRLALVLVGLQLLAGCGKVTEGGPDATSGAGGAGGAAGRGAELAGHAGDHGDGGGRGGELGAGGATDGAAGAAATGGTGGRWAVCPMAELIGPVGSAHCFQCQGFIRAETGDASVPGGPLLDDCQLTDANAKLYATAYAPPIFCLKEYPTVVPAFCD